MDVTELLTYLRIIGKRLWLILLLMVVTVAVIVAMVVTEPPVYRATVRLQVIASDPLFSPTGTASYQDLIDARDDFVGALSSTQVAWETVSDLELGIDAIGLLNHVAISKDDVYVTVNVEAETPEMAFQIAETHVNKALEYYRAERARPAQVFRNFLAAQLKEEGQVLSEANTELLQFRLKNNIVRPDNEALSYQAMIRDLQLERDRTEIDAIRAEAVAKEMEIKAQDAAAKADEAEKREASGTATYYTNLAQRYAAQLLEYEISAIAARAAIARYDQLIAEKKAQMLSLIQIGDVYSSLSAAVSRIEANYNFLLSKDNEARLRESQANSVGFIDILEPARYPDQQAASKLPRLVFIGVVVSLLSGIILAFLLEFVESLGQPVTPSTHEP